MTEYFIRVEPSEVENFYTVTFSLNSDVEVEQFEDIPYKLAFAASNNPERSLVILRAYEAFEVLMLLDDPATESNVLTQRLDNLRKLFTSRVTTPQD